jgi:hypothetical protein
LPTCDLARQVFTALPLTAVKRTPSRFLAVPSIGEPRWLLPDDGGKIDSVLSNWSPYRASSRCKWWTLRAVNRIGALPWLPNLTAAEIAKAAVDWKALGWIGSAAPVQIIYVGTPGVARKAVVHLVDQASGQCGAIVKVPLGEAAGRAIVREADILNALAGEKCCCAPRLLHVDRERGIATQAFIPGKPGNRRFGERECSLLRCLLLRDETTTIAQHAIALEEHTIWPSAPQSHSDILLAVLSHLDDTTLLPACWVHGDFAPWNIRYRHGRSSILIDWEDAQRGGLPLHDAYHFLHMQDYVFDRKPTVHSTEVEGFARTLGITATQCHKLELAYLAAAYLKCIAIQEPVHAAFLLKTLSMAVQTSCHPVVIAVKDVTGLHSVSRHSAAGSRDIRAQLFAAMIAQFNCSGLRYCILGGYENDMPGETSDVDIMVHPRDMRRVPAVLAQSAHSAGALLVQAIQHETTAHYFVLARQCGRQIGFLDPDCCSDYRRRGRLWLSAEKVIAKRRRYQDFYVPSDADQFTYYLLKKVLKQSVDSRQLKLLQHLYARQPAECQRRLTRFWPPMTAFQLQTALVERNLAWFQDHMEGLLRELKQSAPPEHGLARIKAKFCDLQRLLRRAVCPTGMSLSIMGSERGLRSEIADALLQNLAPAFRWTAKAIPANTVTTPCSLARKIFYARRRSTLVVTATEGEPRVRGLCHLAPMLSRPAFRS